MITLYDFGNAVCCQKVRIRGAQIPIEHAARPTCSFPRFPLEVFRRWLQQPADPAAAAGIRKQLRKSSGWPAPKPFGCLPNR